MADHKKQNRGTVDAIMMAVIVVCAILVLVELYNNVLAAL